MEKLWLYNLHYFNDLLSECDNIKKKWLSELIALWIAGNPPGEGNGWEPYPLSLRIVNWIKWNLGGNKLTADALHSLAVQTRYLRQRVEIHLQGNHLFANAKALFFAGLFFDGPEAGGWLEKGLRILKQEVREQILRDGGHFERSTMYHALALEDMLDLCNITAAFAGAVPSHWQSIIETWQETIDTMRDWLAAMCHPDGEISFFNDAAMGIAPAPDELEQYAARLGFSNRSLSIKGITHLSESGYIRIEQNGAVLLLDVAPVGPDYLPAHAHADTLSFEMSLFGQRVFVNSGTSCYGNSGERLRQRGTAAHNTVMVNGQDSSEVWAGFRMARRARPVGLKVVRHDRMIMVRCAHDGYRRLSGQPTHMRKWLLDGNALVVEDLVSGRFERAEARFHLHPSIILVGNCKDSVKDRNVMLQLPQGQKIRFSVEGGTLRQETTTWHPKFGCSKPNICLVADFNRSVLRTQIEWDSGA